MVPWCKDDAARSSTAVAGAAIPRASKAIVPSNNFFIGISPSPAIATIVSDCIRRTTFQVTIRGLQPKVRALGLQQSIFEM